MVDPDEVFCQGWRSTIRPVTTISSHSVALCRTREQILMVATCWDPLGEIHLLTTAPRGQHSFTVINSQLLVILMLL